MPDEVIQARAKTAAAHVRCRRLLAGMLFSFAIDEP